MKKKTTLLYSTLGVVAMFVLFVAFNFLAAHFKHRFDLTQEKAYTLSPGTRAILAKLDTPVQIRFYCTQGENAMPVFLKTYAQRVEDMLSEFKRASKQIEITKLDPQPDSDAEDSANLEGVEGQPLPTGEKIFLGVSVSMLDQKQALPFLSPDREQLLEYDLARAITRVVATEKPVVGIMSSLPVAGSMNNEMMMQTGQRGSEPWAFYTELSQDYNLKQIEMSADSIPDEVKVLVLIHPRAISDAALFAIDQFLMRGGKMVAFLDPACVLEKQNPMMGGGPGSSNLEKLLKAWGLSFNSDKVVADLNYVAQTRQGKIPALLALDENAINKNDIVTADAENVVMAFAGAFSGTAAPGLTETVLIHSSKNSQLVNPMSAQMSGEETINNFVASNTEYPLAIRLTGKFKSAFPEGKPAANDAQATPPPSGKESKPAPAGLKESTRETSVILLGDCDMIQDPIAVTEVENPFAGGRMVMPSNGNIALAQGIVDQLAGDSDLIAVRSRGARERPFTVVKEMESRAESSYRSKIHELEQSLRETQGKLNELQSNKQNGQGAILSQEQQQELGNFRKKETEVKKELKLVRRNLRGDIDSLENRIKWLNIAAMPLLIAAAGLALAFFKRKRVEAR